MGFVASFLGIICFLLWLLVLGRVLLSWFDPAGRSALARFLISTTEPLLAPIRGMLPRSGMLDLSGFVVLIVLGFIWRALL